MGGPGGVGWVLRIKIRVYVALRAYAMAPLSGGGPGGGMGALCIGLVAPAARTREGGGLLEQTCSPYYDTQVRSATGAL